MKQDSSWAIEQITEYLVAITSFSSESAAMMGGLEHIVETFDAEAGAVVGPDGVLASLGFGSGEVPYGQLVEIIGQRHGNLEVPGAGRCDAVALRLRVASQTFLVIARAREPFSKEEMVLAHGMAKVFSLAMDQVGLIADQRAALEAERRLRERNERQMVENSRLLAIASEREALLERLARIQRSISTHSPLEEVFAAIVQGAKDLLDDEVIGLRLIDSDNPNTIVMAASLGMSDATLAVVRRQNFGTGLGGRSIHEGSLVVMDPYSVENGGLEVFVDEGVKMAMSAPIHSGGEIVGSLTVGSTRERRPYSDAEQDILLSFAEHASLALTDAQTMAAMHEAMHDSLTGLPSRALFFDRLEHSFASTGRTELSVGLLFIDLDLFKPVNDRLGHAVGDQILIEAASRIRGCLRESDTPARLGGDEFTVLVEHVLDMDAVISTAKRIAKEIERPFVMDGAELNVTASIGVAFNSPELSSGEDLLRHADVAMYAAKSRGGNCVVAYDQSLSDQDQLS